MRHEVSRSCPDLRKASADSNAAARKPKDSISSFVVLRTDSSSSTTEIRLLATLNAPSNSKYSSVKKDSIGPWWICGHRKENAYNAFVYDAFSGRLLIFHIIHAQPFTFSKAAKAANSGPGPTFQFTLPLETAADQCVIGRRSKTHTRRAGCQSCAGWQLLALCPFLNIVKSTSYLTSPIDFCAFATAGSGFPGT